MIKRFVKRLFTPREVTFAELAPKLAVVAVLAVGVIQWQSHILVTVSKSVEPRIFWKTGEEPTRDDYATFMFEHELAGEEPVRLTKRLACWSGDSLTVTGRDVYCNDEFLGTAKETGLTGQELPLFEFNGVIPNGLAFAVGSHADSFDSRYWGFVDVSTTERVVPIFNRKGG